jgi:glycosyltransferase involved in cell wall biosynthesis
MKRILFCWDVINSYMASCWRELAALKNIDLKVFAVQKNSQATTFTYKDSITKGFSARLFDIQDLQDRKAIIDSVSSFQPGCLFICGWNIPAYAELITDHQLSGIPKVMTMDTNYLGTWRQRLASLKIGRYLKNIDLLFVPGERSRQLARHWNIPERKIRKGLYSMDYEGFAKAMDERLNLDEWPRKFLFAGQYIERKGVHHLLQAYKEYRESVDNPWSLICCGAGPLEDEIRGCTGVDERGFVQPNNLPDVMVEAGAFIHPSLYDPWGVVIAEACAAGLPVLATDGCAATVELVHDYANGIVLPTADVHSLSKALVWVHENYEALPLMGKQAHELARPYSAQAWTKRVQAIVNDLT